MSFQELCNKYKEEVCPYCIQQEECNICKTSDGVRCSGYKKDRSKFKKRDKAVQW